jgi:16S rRNA (guanine527-N7)-methyltransferase
MEPLEEQIRLLRAHFAAVLETNRKFNLTRVTEPDDAAVTLYADSLAVVAWAERNAVRAGAVLDAGTGAGFPAVPVAVMQPRWQVTAIDATRKKADFVADCARDLPVPNLTARHARVEQTHAPPAYDLILFKAVSRIEQCLHWSQHGLARGGYVVLYKTARISAAEEDAGRRTAGRLGYHEADRFQYTLRRGAETLPRVLRLFARR